MKKRTIERNEDGKLVKWYGFWISKDASNEICYLDFFRAKEPNHVTLCLRGEAVAVIDYSALYDENIAKKKVVHTENAILEYIYTECRKYEKHRKIYVDEIDAQIVSVAGTLEDFMSDQEVDLENYFLEQQQKYE